MRSVLTVDVLETRYRILLPDGKQVTFDIRLATAGLEPVDPLPGDLPVWARLEFCQCANCPLTPDQHPWCPLAARLVPIVRELGHLESFRELSAEVITEERTIRVEHAQAQDVLSSMMGLVTATSGCPHTAFFKPMARFHLPFSSLEESLYRVISMYALAQNYRYQKGMVVDFNLDGLVDIYRTLDEVNRSVAKRMRAASRQDVTVNAIVLLDMLGQALPDMFSDGQAGIAELFEPYLQDAPGDGLFD